MNSELIKQYNKVFATVFQCEESGVEALCYKQHPLWDSVGQIMLVQALEEEFDVMLSSDDILNLTSYTVGLEIIDANLESE